MLAHGRLGEAERFRGGRERPPLSDLTEDPHAPHVEHKSSLSRRVKLAPPLMWSGLGTRRELPAGGVDVASASQANGRGDAALRERRAERGDRLARGTAEPRV